VRRAAVFAPASQLSAGLHVPIAGLLGADERVFFFLPKCDRAGRWGGGGSKWRPYLVPTAAGNDNADQAVRSKPSACARSSAD
jgi:hypothetical protein